MIASTTNYEIYYNQALIKKQNAKQKVSIY